MLASSSSSFVWLLLLLLFLHLSDCVPIDSVMAPFSGLVRERLLYTGNRRQGLFMEIDADGSVQASPDPSSNCVLELRSLSPGKTIIQGVRTSLFLCVNSQGHLRGQRDYVEEDCTFRELLMDSYTLFLSPHTGLPVSLRFKGNKPGRRRGPLLYHFLPVMNNQVPQKYLDSVQPGRFVGHSSLCSLDHPFLSLSLFQCKFL
ncbi:fibroblast growth factor 21 isoform X2 [Astyanax mexicanus]|uniref:Fibroblast growth factor 21-like n=1 Tax=Astyanax mexicanus TaxID=7994 RepID=A0A8T2L457_ASTMX|nr:fibroblast growth factor 21 isoform X2 [Astyanax mexicanus]KAG9264086.1 fibroblast growth factor 21-like [Astyanax mexicanus]